MSEVINVLTKDIETKDQNDKPYYALHVQDLSFVPPKTLLNQGTEFMRKKLNAVQFGWVLPSMKEVNKPKHLNAPLHRVHFSAVSSEVTAILGNQHERAELIHLMSGRRKTGTFEGDIVLNGPALRNDSYYYDNMAFVQKEPLYIPGLTYYEMLHFSAQLRLKGNKVSVDDRVQELITLFNLTACKNKVIPSFPGERGESSGDLRRLSIAMEIADLPPLIIVDEPTINLDVALSLNIMQSLQTLARRGHVVICSMSKPYPQELDYIDRLVVLSEGYSIYASPTRHVQRFFSSPAMGYDVRKGMDIAEFLIDVANGTERPIQSRAADLPFIMQQKYEESDVYETIPNSSAFSVSAFHQDFFYLHGYGRVGDRRYAWTRLTTVVKRAIYTKCRDFEQLKMNLIGPVVIGVVYGYLNLQTGSYGRYCTGMFGIPYAQTTNVGGLFFFIASFSFMLPHVSSHVVCQKIELFRYEQASGVCTSFAFIVACLFSEVPFAVVGSLLLSSIIYGFTVLGTDGDDFSYFAEIMILLNLLGVVGSYWLGLMIRKELIIRDLILIVVVLVAILSGFPVQLQTMPDYIASATQLNPLRWAFEGLMAWKFSEYDDGNAYLLPYNFNTFDHNNAKGILNNFIWVTFGAALLFSLNTPLLLQKAGEKDSKKPNMDSKSRDSIDSLGGDFPHPDDRIIPRKLTRQSEAVKPVLFMRESSVTGSKQSNLSVSISQTGELNSDRGPTVAFKDINYRVLDKESPGGYRTVLSRVSGQFDWGKLSCVMGSTGSGKSSLLHILAGDVPMGAEIGGKIYFNEKSPDPSQLLWQRCGFVPIANEHLRDLTVKEVVRFAMLLRCYNSLGLSVVDENVDKTLQILSLTDVTSKKTKELNNGELKRLSIAEEMVHGPKLLLMDEPLTNISLVESSILTMCFREMVNQDRTVVATVHQPHAEIVKLFDTMLLLSRGRVIYYGTVSNAAQYFVSSPFGYNLGNYTNPADFLADISGGYLADCKGEFVDSSILEHYYKESEVYGRLRNRMKKFDRQAQLGSDVSNPIGSNRDSERDISISSVPDAAVSVDRDGDEEKESASMSRYIPPKPAAPLPMALQGLYLVGTELKTIFSSRDNFHLALFKGRILFQRSVFALTNRVQLIVSSCVLHIFLAILFGWVMGDSSGNEGIYNTTAFFALSAMFLILTNIPMSFYMFNNHGVFLKEHARGLYPNVLRWVVMDHPLNLLRVMNSIIFFTIAWAMINQTTLARRYGFALLMYMTFVLLTVFMTEFVVAAADTKRDCYVTITALGFLNMLLSGLLIKGSTMPTWVSPWAPSISAVRWAMQGNFINLYHESGSFPTFPNGYTLYTSFLTLYGWGGKDKWYCYGMIVLMLIVFKFLALWTSSTSAMGRKGGAKFRQIFAQGLTK